MKLRLGIAIFLCGISQYLGWAPSKMGIVTPQKCGVEKPSESARRWRIPSQRSANLLKKTASSNSNGKKRNQ